MSDEENFLTRWSRRKSEAAESGAAPAEVPKEPAGPLDDQMQKEDTQPAFDPTSLPPLDSIEAGTDITAFLRAGVPSDLARAALRRAWATDPNIRDFVGLSENSWDFTADSIPGFGPLSPEDAGELLARYTGKVAEAANKVGQILQGTEPSRPAQVGKIDTEVSVRRTESGPPEAAQGSLPEAAEQLPSQCSKKHSATQNNLPAERRHGGALPRK